MYLIFLFKKFKYVFSIENEKKFKIMLLERSLTVTLYRKGQNDQLDMNLNGKINKNKILKDENK